MKKIPVGILGATGMVGQHYVHLLSNHPLFTIAFLAASPESAGKSYKDALRAKGGSFYPIPPEIEKLPVHSVDAIDTALKNCSFVFSALNTESAKLYEEKYAALGLPVITNASTHRLSSDVPLLIPEINAQHLELIPIQQTRRGWKKGFIIAKPNCSIQSYLIPLFPLHKAFRIKQVIVTTLQAISGAGYPGVSSLDIMDNVIPYIAGEEEKSENEPLKILGSVKYGKLNPVDGVKFSAHCNRVPVMDGHLACVSVSFEIKPKAEEILDQWNRFEGLKLHSAPSRPIIYRHEVDRPQPRLDRNAEEGMAISVGRLRSCPILDFRFVSLSHNLLRGAAKGGILNAELALEKGYL